MLLNGLSASLRKAMATPKTCVPGSRCSRAPRRRPRRRGENALEYNLVLRYNLERDQLKLPGVQRLIPIFELNGETALSHQQRGDNALFGTAGFRVSFTALGPAQPRLGLGYVFPIDSGARDQLRWGIVTSLVFEF